MTLMRRNVRISPPKKRRNISTTVKPKGMVINTNLRQTLEEESEEENYYNSPTELRGDENRGKFDSELSLPHIDATTPRRVNLLKNSDKNRSYKSECNRVKKCDSIPANESIDTSDNKSQRSARSQQQPFKVHVIKDYKYDKTIREQREKAKADAELEENKRRTLAVKILQNHGVSAAQGYEASRRASIIRKASANSMRGVNNMIQQYQQEIDAYKQRILQLEQQEVTRLAKEAAYRQELFDNHGKPASFFKVPGLATKKRSNHRRFQKLMYERETAEQTLAQRQNEQANSYMRGSKYALGKDHYDLV